jgi:uncharacterized protein (DUF58 family)
VYARARELFAKTLEDDDRRTLTLFLDRSRSMLASEPARLVAAQRLAAIAGALGLVRLDALRVVRGPGQSRAFEGAAAIPALLDYLAGGGDDYRPLAMVRQPLEAGWLGRFLWISDFAVPSEVEPALRLLRQHGRACAGVLPALAGEDRAPELRDGLVRLIDPETGREEVMRIDAAVRAAMARELERLAQHQDATFARFGYTLFRVPVPALDDLRPNAWFAGAWTASI